MKSCQHNRAMWFLAFAAVGVLLTGCPPKPPRPRGKPSQTWTTDAAGPSTTVSPGVTGGMDVVVIEEPEIPDEPQISPEDAIAMNLVAMDLELPAPAFRGTPVPAKVPNVQKPLGKPRPAFLVPKGTVNISLGKPVTTSDPSPGAGETDYVTDGDKEASDFGYLELRPGSEWAQVDLGEKSAIYAIVVWHNHAEARIYHDVVVQVSDDPDFVDPATTVTVFNNDYDGSSGLGIGTDLGYVETSEGKLIDAKGVEGRYIRLYSRGNHIDNKNHYTEVEVHGKPAT